MATYIAYIIFPKTMCIFFIIKMSVWKIDGQMGRVCVSENCFLIFAVKLGHCWNLLSI